MDEAYKTIDDKTTIIDSQTSMIKNKETLISGLENQNKEYDIRYKGKVKEMQDNYTKEKEMREQEYIREKQAYIREIGSLYEVIDGIFSRQRNKFDAALLNLSQDSQEKIKSGALNYKFK